MKPTKLSIIPIYHYQQKFKILIIYDIFAREQKLALPFSKTFRGSYRHFKLHTLQASNDTYSMERHAYVHQDICKGCSLYQSVIAKILEAISRVN